MRLMVPCMGPMGFHHLLFLSFNSSLVGFSWRVAVTLSFFTSFVGSTANSVSAPGLFRILLGGAGFDFLAGAALKAAAVFFLLLLG